MSDKITILGLALGGIGILVSLIRINNKLNNIMATLNERLTAVETALDEAGTEISAELAKLREQIANGTVGEDALATIGRLETKAKALADIIPNAA